MAWTASLTATVGSPTKASDYTKLVANVEYVQTLADVQHDFHVSTGTGYHKDVTMTGASRIDMKNTGSVAHGMTGLATTDCYFAIFPYSATHGGVYIRGMMDGDAATGQPITIDAVHGHASPSQALTTFRVGKANGTTFQAIAAGEIGWQWTNYTTNHMTLMGDGQLGLGTASPDGKLHVHTASAGSVAAHSSGDDLIVENSTTGGMSILVPDANGGNIYFGSPTANRYAVISTSYNSGTPYMNLVGADTSSLMVGIHEGANAGMTVGLTINQGANDDAIFALKSSDVAHGGTAWIEDDDFLTIAKHSATGGGAHIVASGDSDLADGNPMSLVGLTEAAASTAKTTAGHAVVETYGALYSGSGGTSNITANGNLFSINCLRGGANVQVFIVDEDGDYYYDGSGSAFDVWEDAPLLRTMQVATSDPKTLVRSKWDEMVKYDKNHLVDSGLIGYCSPEDEEKGHKGLVNGAAMQRALMGEAWQGYCRDMELAEKVEELQNKNALLEQRLKLLEN